MAQININTDAAVVFANKLEKMGRSDLPVVINQTLNNAAFDVKQKTMLESASGIFTIRQKNFFKASSKVQKSSGFNINSMKSTVGFQGPNPAVMDLVKQEHGGSLKRSMIANDDARVGKSGVGNVKKQNRISVIKKSNFVDARKVQGKNKNAKFVTAAYRAKKQGGNNAYVLSAKKTSSGRRNLYRITSIASSIKGRNTTIKSVRVMSIKGNSTVKIKATRFMSKATHLSANKMERFFIKNAKARLKK